VQYYRYAKSEIIAIDKAKEAADLARERNDFRLARIEREKLERAQKHAERAQAAKTLTSDTKVTDEAAASKSQLGSAPAVSDKQAAIAAAIERAKALKLAAAQAGIAPKNVENVSATVQAEISEIDALRDKAQISIKDKDHD
jgi:electron transport complex protein RnfC